jgi:malonyl-CoA decarboxylase
MGIASFLGRLIGREDGIHRGTRHVVSLCRQLLGERGEASGVALARETLAAYRELDDEGREQFFYTLSREFSPSPEEVGKAADAYRFDPTPANLLQLQEAVDTARLELLRRLNMAPGGTAALVEMRATLLEGLQRHPHWAALDADLLHLLRSWFNRGFLRLERIDWRSSAMVLEKLMRYEAVHAIRGWEDLHRRLKADRRCYAFFHPQLPDEPLIFIEVALTRSMSAAVQPLLDASAPLEPLQDANCAVFYSISNCQKGLRGVSFGSFLIKQVAEDLRRELPRVRRFATLSPIPGFMSWLEEMRMWLAVGQKGEERHALLARLADADWHRSPNSPELERLLMPLCAHYLLHAKSEGEPRDPVARFHLGNGASLERLNWLADTSREGIARAAGMMVNYAYRLRKVERNHELFVKQQRIAASRDIERLARESPLAVGAPAPTEA